MPEEVVTAEQGQAAATSSEGYSADELRAMIREEVGAHLTPFAQAVQERLAPVEQMAAAVKDLMGRSAKTEALIDRIFDGTMTQADRIAVTEKLEQDSVKEQLRVRDEADRKAAAAAARQPQVAGNLDADWQETFGPRAMAYAKKNDVDYAQVYAQFPKQLKSLPSGRPDWNGFMDTVETIIDRQADTDRKAAKPRVRIDTTKPAGTREPADLSKGGLSLFQKHYEERTQRLG